MVPASFPQWLDRLAVSLSSLCALHCLALPLLLVLVPAMSASVLGDEAFHRTLLWLVIPSSVLAITLGCARHKDQLVWTCAVTGLAVMIIAAFWGHDLLGEWGERLATLTGAGILSSGHVRNHALCRSRRCLHDAACD